MHRRHARALVVLGAMIASAGCMPSALGRPPPPTPGGGTIPEDPAGRAESLEQRVYDLVNEHRRSRGLPSLSYDGRIAEIAREHSGDMAAGRVPFSHDGFEDRARRVRGLVDYRKIAENVHWNNSGQTLTADVAVDGWLHSPAHRENIEGAYDVTGIGVAESAGGRFFYTQIFLRRP